MNKPVIAAVSGMAVGGGFELMLSAFILGLALGAWLVRDWADRADPPLRLLGGVQLVMGLAALATLPLYGVSFEVMSVLIR